jgi:hypothetical protein
MKNKLLVLFPHPSLNRSEVNVLPTLNDSLGALIRAPS